MSRTVTARPSLQENTNGVTILVIDGYKDDRVFYAARLKAVFPDGRVLEAQDGQIGSEILRRVRIDVLILELELPDISGFEILISAIPVARSPQLPVIVLTRIPDPAFWELARKNGAFACLWKSITSGRELTATVMQGLARIPQAKEREPRFSPSGRMP